jgi:hypothetical protein
MIKKIAILAAVIIVVIILAVVLWPRTKTVTVTAAAATVTTTITKTLPQPATTVTVKPSSLSQPVTTTVTITTTAAPTFSPCAYQGSLTGIWSGKMPNGIPMNGTLAIAIDSNGGAKGTFDGSFSGTITGNVDLSGNISAVGTTASGPLHVASSWSARLAVTGNSMSAQGTWNSGDAGGTCSGTGTITH